MRLWPFRAMPDWHRALGELVLIVGGVLIALAVDAWWQGREERELERAYLEQLLSDARETERRLAESIAGDSAMLAMVGEVIDRAFAAQLPPADSFQLPFGYTQFRPLSGTHTALIQSGDIQVLRNDSIRFHLIAHAALIDATEVLLRHTESLIWDSGERILHGRLVHARRGGAWAPVDIAAVLNDPDVVSALQVQAMASGNRVRNLQRLREPNAELIRQLERELAGNGDPDPRDGGVSTTLPQPSSRAARRR